MSDRVELIYFVGCPHVAEARQEIARALRRCGMAPVWREWDTDGPDTPDAFKGHASPTVLVDGVNVTGAQSGTGAGCSVAGAPPADLIVSALGTVRGTAPPGVDV